MCPYHSHPVRPFTHNDNDGCGFCILYAQRVRIQTSDVINRVVVYVFTRTELVPGWDQWLNLGIDGLWGVCAGT